MNQVPTKIVLKSTTRMSLNDRFSNIVPNVQTMRANMAAEHQVSSANRRLAQQLANRPGISQNQAASMMYNNNNNNNRQQGRGRRGGASVQQRVGKGNIKARLSLPPNRGGQQLQGGRGARGGFRGGRGGGAVHNGAGDNYGSWTMSTFQPRGRGVISPRNPRGGRGTYRGGRGQQFNRDSVDLNKYPPGDNGPRYRGRRRPRGHNSDRFTGQATIRGGARGRGQGQMQRGGGTPRGRGGFNNRRGRGFNRGGRGGAVRGGRGGGNNTKLQTSVMDLDNQLDQYMAKSKSALDTELDAYMAQVSTD